MRREFETTCDADILHLNTIVDVEPARTVRRAGVRGPLD